VPTVFLLKKQLGYGGGTHSQQPPPVVGETFVEPRQPVILRSFSHGVELPVDQGHQSAQGVGPRNVVALAWAAWKFQVFGGGRRPASGTHGQYPVHQS
jgi:hypothetical protein